MKEKIDFIDQMIVRVWKACNFKCNFCNVADNETHVKQKESIMDIVRNFHYKFKYSCVDSWNLLVTISGGEPSIFKKETLFSLKYVRSFLEKRGIHPIFDIQTNASSITKDFARRLKEGWVYLALVSFHTNDRDIFNEIIQVDYGSFFPKILEWIEELHNAGILVDLNIVLNKSNYTNFLDNLTFLIHKFPFIDTFNVGFVQPHGNAFENFDELFVSYQEIYEIYNKWIALLSYHKRKIVSHFVWLPACYLDQKSYSTELQSNIFFHKTFRIELDKKNLINNINDSNKKQVQACNDCSYSSICSWIWKEYEWHQTLRPIKYLKFFQLNGALWKNTSTVLMNYHNYEKIRLKWELDGNKKGIFIQTRDIPYEEIYKKIREANALGFFKTSVFFNDTRKIDLEILKTGVANIQIDISQITIDQIKEVLDFSKLYAPQFRIDLDIIISSYQDVLQVSSILHLLPSNFLKIFILKEKKIEKERYEEFFEKKSFYRFSQNIFTVGFYKKLVYR